MPHSSELPHRSSIRPQCTPWAAHVVGSLIVKSFGIWLYFATPLPELALRIPTYILTGAAEYVILTLILKNKALSALLEKV